ncbi:MAG: hypothetical protein LC789_06440 [Actinobacteria bacterium]|nr:hypothetical protein [Actinomycetota bacterium]MCA1720439.1 hypothetical protein [Actinomycetota bacterium]
MTQMASESLCGAEIELLLHIAASGCPADRARERAAAVSMRCTRVLAGVALALGVIDAVMLLSGMSW